jgi:hypothetical protein
MPFELAIIEGFPFFPRNRPDEVFTPYGRLSTIETVEHKVSAWQEHRNQAQIGVDWRFTADDARLKLKRLYPIVNVQESA